MVQWHLLNYGTIKLSTLSSLPALEQLQVRAIATVQAAAFNQTLISSQNTDLNASLCICDAFPCILNDFPCILNAVHVEKVIANRKVRATLFRMVKQSRMLQIALHQVLKDNRENDSAHEATLYLLLFGPFDYCYITKKKDSSPPLNSKPLRIRTQGKLGPTK